MDYRGGEINDGAGAGGERPCDDRPDCAKICCLCRSGDDGYKSVCRLNQGPIYSRQTPQRGTRLQGGGGEDSVSL